MPGAGNLTDTGWYMRIISEGPRAFKRGPGRERKARPARRRPWRALRLDGRRRPWRARGCLDADGRAARGEQKTAGAPPVLRFRRLRRGSPGRRMGFYLFFTKVSRAFDPHITNP